MTYDLYAWKTGNCFKIAIMLEECNLDYKVNWVDVNNNEQFKPEFLKISPNNKVPTLIDNEANINIFESGAILIYLAEKTGLFLSKDPVKKSQVIQWLMFQMSGIGPTFGNLRYFELLAETKFDLAINRFKDESVRLLKVLDKQLSKFEFIAKDYSIADIALFPWLKKYDRYQITIDDFPNIQRWRKTVGDRPAVQKGLSIRPS